LNKLLLISGLLFSGGIFASPMDERCYINGDAPLEYQIEKIAAFCERNNLLYLTRANEFYIINAISLWCRKDRAINFVKVSNYVGGEGERYELSCVLYSNKPRSLAKK